VNLGEWKVSDAMGGQGPKKYEISETKNGVLALRQIHEICSTSNLSNDGGGGKKETPQIPGPFKVPRNTALKAGGGLTTSRRTPRARVVRGKSRGGGREQR